MLPTLLLLQAPGPNATFGLIFQFVAIGAIIYFLLLRPQQKQRKQQEETLRTLKRGDEVVTLGGIVGEVVLIKEQTAGKPGADDHLTIRSGDTRLIVERRGIARVGGAAPATPAA